MKTFIIALFTFAALATFANGLLSDQATQYYGEYPEWAQEAFTPEN